MNHWTARALTVAVLFGAAHAQDVRVLQVRGNVHLISGAGANITVLVGPDGLMLVDTGTAEMSDKVLAAVRKLSDKPIHHIVNTHFDGDHTGGNAKLAAAGKTLTGGNVAGTLADSGEGAAVIAHENVLERMSAVQPPVPFRALPTDTYYVEGMKLSTMFHENEPVQLIHLPAAHTDGDTLVHFRKADILVTGDVLDTTRYPVIDLQHGGSIQGVIDALNRILDLAFPEFRLEGGTLVIPGHGRVCDSADVAYYRDMVTIIRDRIQDMIRRDMTLEQVKAAKPTLDYDGLYGADSGPWTTDMFVEAVYRSLSRKR
jgi:glyoxylase-like metal-dependent hydrolase (beta-lactamase superfamily II)